MVKLCGNEDGEWWGGEGQLNTLFCLLVRAGTHKPAESWAWSSGMGVHLSYSRCCGTVLSGFLHEVGDWSGRREICVSHT